MKVQPRARAAALAIALQLAFSAIALAPMRSVADESRPERYRSDFARFSVAFPGGSPVVRQLEGTKFTMTGNDVNYAEILDGVEYSVEIHDVPRFAKIMLTDHYILDQSVKGKLEDIGARSLDVVETSIQDEPAREVVFEALDRKFTGRMWLVLADRRLYLVGVLHPPSLDSQQVGARFFESFSFWLE
ncbi:MAG: hypothetical protein JRE43_05970 [Deltaproteobacteria bacterium]|nr:hypothetical protein [Deltaproteobacteria bacterium]MBW2540688.1 hypothetical protein [Deltaproteobacteria bacterium]